MEKTSTEPKKQEIAFAHKDRLGSSVALFDHEGKLKETHSFDPFGKPRKSIDTARLNTTLASDFSTRGFTDHEHMDNIQIIHMNGRGYDYNLGRFLSVDPFIVDPGNSQAINPYSYILNNPLSGTDPTGYASDNEGNDDKDTDDDCNWVAGWSCSEYGSHAEQQAAKKAHFAAKNKSNSSPGGRNINFHAADRMVNPPRGRAEMTPSEIDKVLDGATNIRKRSHHPQGDTLTIQNRNMRGNPQVVVDAATGKKLSLLLIPKRRKRTNLWKIRN